MAIKVTDAKNLPAIIAVSVIGLVVKISNVPSRFSSLMLFIVMAETKKINMYGAIACYIFLVFGLNYFILSANKSVMDAFILGIVIYGVFETTNVVLFKKWPTYIAVMDTVWGGILFALTTYVIKQIKI